MNNKLMVTTALCFFVAATTTACGPQTPSPVETTSSPDGAVAPSSATPPAATQQSGTAHRVPASVALLPQFQGVLEPGVEYHAIVEMAKGGEFEIVFFPEAAPNHVANFVSLARKGFYDGVTFHRVIEGFMAQGGDPTGSGSGGPGYTIPAEFSQLPHKRGTLSMARTSDPNSAGSQFYICFARTEFLDGQYTVFGEVIRGMDVVDKIRRRDPERNPDYAGDAMRSVKITEVR